MSKPFYSLVTKFCEIIESNEYNKKGKLRRKRTGKESEHFRNAVKMILRTLWNDLYTVPPRDSSWVLHRNYYSTEEYRVLNDRRDITNFKCVQSVTNVLIRLRYIIVTEDHEWKGVGSSKNRRRLHRPSPELKKMLIGLNDNGEVQIPAIHFVLPSYGGIHIELKENDKFISFGDDFPDLLNEEMSFINSVLANHWADLLLKDNEWDDLAKRLTTEHLDLGRRQLTRIFSNGTFDNTGRMYRCWWQEVPNKVPKENPEFIPYRKRITIDGRNTDELDYSALGPNIFYNLCNKDMGNEDPYSRVFKDGQHRNLIKKALNALIQANSRLARYCPRDADLRTLLSEAKEELGFAKIETDDEIHAAWRDLRRLILKSHPDVADQFGEGLGGKIQFEDSSLIIKVMLHFGRKDIPILSVHDSLITNWDVVESGELLFQMEKAFYERFGKYIKIKGDPPMSGKPVDSIIDYGGYASPEDFLDYIDKTGEYKIWVARQRAWNNNKHNLESPHMGNLVFQKHFFVPKR